MKAISNSKKEPTVIKVKNITPVLKNKHQLSQIIVDLRGRPDTLAINLYWDEFRSWHNPKKIYNKGNVVHSSQLKKKGISTSYKKLVTKYNVSENTIRRKLVLLEQLEIISRDFETETKFKKVFHNQLVIYVWQQTPHFYNPIGVDREQIKELKLSTNHEYVESKYSKSSTSANNDNKTPCNTSDNLACKGDEGIIIRDDRGYPHEVEINSASQAQLDKGIKADRGILKNENTNIKVQNSSQSQSNKGVEGKGGIIIRDDRGIIVAEDTYILREELESLIESSLRSSFKDTPVIGGSNTESYETKKIIETNHATFSNAILTEHSQVAITKPEKSLTDCEQSNQQINKPESITALEEKPSTLHPRQPDPNERSEDGVGALMTKISSSQEQVVDSKMQITPIPHEQNVEPLETQITNKNEEVLVKREYSQVDNKQTKRMLLSKALYGAFGEHSANEIQDHCKFEETEVGKITIKPDTGVSFNDIEKAKIRKCIQSVYGEDVVLVLLKTTPYVNNPPVASKSGLAKGEFVKTSSQGNSQWINFKANVGDRKVLEILNNPTVKVIEIPGKIIIETHAFLIEELFASGYVDALEDAVVETGLTLEFHAKIVSRAYATPDAKPTILCKEKIMKDREWRKNIPDDLGIFINEIKKNNR